MTVWAWLKLYHTTDAFTLGSNKYVDGKERDERSGWMAMVGSGGRLERAWWAI